MTTTQTMNLPNGLAVSHVSVGETALLYRDIFAERCYMQHGITLSPGGTVFDVGANIGMSTLFFHTECPGLTFHAFEPAPIPYAALSANIDAHGIDATATRCALSDHAGTGRLTYYPDSTVMSGFHADARSEADLTRTFLVRSGFDDEDVEDMLAGRHDTVEIECPVRTLSQVIAEHGTTSIDLLKIDVEKSELEVLQGLEEADWPKVRQVVAEVHDLDGTLKAFVSLLADHGFDVAVEQDALLADTEIYEVFAVRKAG
ncbi:FkbM family methyltransferase [Streptomyces populi]|uniref:FkbM family methyltransferase n=1 Tax=Streptomyces populi TaxID=2058924 RepID=A0A2I0SX10_9ACTN|nr:FkbM family methyltransferase [Streptomyces populi]PKT74471.1 FkbM family methyltransferase [Streptomyces populi]